VNPLIHIRKSIFGFTQAEMARLAKVSQGTVSRWEAGELSPDRNAMRRIRAAALKKVSLKRGRGKSWDDRWFFELPEAAE
jgi:transcriptional regulator with XRE-family HTH domain